MIVLRFGRGVYGESVGCKLGESVSPYWDGLCLTYPPIELRAAMNTDDGGGIYKGVNRFHGFCGFCGLLALG